MGQFLRPEKLGVLSKVSDTQVNLTPSILNIGGQQFSILSNLVLNLASSGFGGLDTGSITASTTYHVYAVINGGGAAGLVASLSLPNIGPSGFPQNKYIWSIHTDQSSKILEFIRAGRKNIFVDSLKGVQLPVSGLTNNPALTIDTSGAGDVFPQNTNVPSNNLAFTNSMLGGIADTFEGQFMAQGDGGSAEWVWQMWETVSGVVSIVFGVAAKQVSQGKVLYNLYEGRVGADYTIAVGVSPSMTNRIMQNQILSYENKLVGM